MSGRLSHTDVHGRMRMVDVGDKPETAREAVASAAVRMSPATLALALGSAANQPPGKGDPSGKGDVLAAARFAAIAALKRTADWIPLCHPIRLVGSAVDLEGDEALPGIRVRVTARAFDRTGVEMEAMVGAAAAALTIYDMVKGAERGVEILSVRLEEKRGGRTGEWSRDVAARAKNPTGQTARAARFNTAAKKAAKNAAKTVGKTKTKTKTKVKIKNMDNSVPKAVDRVVAKAAVMTGRAKAAISALRP